MMEHGPVDSVGGQPSSNNVSSSSGSGQGGGNTTGRRPVKERLGVRIEDWGYGIHNTLSTNLSI